jgi:hypothetical protein
MKRGAIAFAIVAVLLLGDGSYLQATHNEVGGDSGILFGNAHLFLSAGTVVIISGVMLIVAAAIMWGVAIWRDRRAPAGAGRAPAGAGQAAAQPSAAAQVKVGEEQGHQRQS